MKKITFRVPRTLWASFTLQTQKLFINRGPFLDHLLTIELPYVTKDLGDYRMSAKARRYISALLTRQDSKPVNIEIQDATTQMLNDVVEKHDLLRDALLCRLLIFIRCSDSLMNYLEVPEDVTSIGHGVESLSTSPMKALEQIYSDPLFYVRSHINSTGFKCGVYNCELSPKMGWALCFLEDKDVPNTKEYKQRQKELEELSKIFDFDIL